MTDIPIRELTIEGEQLYTGVAGSGSLVIPNNDGLVMLEVTNPTGGNLNVTITPSATIGGMSLSPTVVVCPANLVTWVRCLPPAIYNQPNGTVLVSAPSGLTLRGIRI